MNRKRFNQQTLIKLQTYEDVKKYFEKQHGIKVMGLSNFDLDKVKITLAGCDDVLREFGGLGAGIRHIKYDKNLRYCGAINPLGLLKIEAKKPYEVFAYSIETEMGDGESNDLSREVFKVLKEVI